MKPSRKAKRSTHSKSGTHQGKYRDRENLAENEVEQERYRCSKCQLAAIDTGKPLDYVKPPRITQLRNERLLQVCPNEGPESLHLVDPDHPRRQRVRFFFDYGAMKARLCTPFVLQKERRFEPGRSAERVYGPALSPPRMQCKWFVREYLRRNGPAKDVDLGNFHPARKVTFGEVQRLEQDHSGRWYLSPPRWVDCGDWVNDVLRSGVAFTVKDIRELYDLPSIAEALHDSADTVARASGESKRSTVYIPVDLRFSIKEQLDRQIGAVREIQKYLLALSERRGALKPDLDVGRRRFQCYSFSKYFGLNATKIARLVFPKERPKKAATKVRNELRRVRLQLEKQQGPGA